MTARPPPLDPRQPAEPAVFLVLAGPAGSGKTTLCERMVREVPEFSRVVTATTRPPRPGEVDGIHYHFLTSAQFDTKVAAGEFLEWAWVHQKNRYGTLTSSILEPLRQGRSLIVNVDVQGVDNLRRAAETSALLRERMASIFINVQLAELRERMVGRGHDEDAEILRRLETAAQELQELHKFDYRIEGRSRDEDFQALLEVWKAVRKRVRKT
jgi:guanylate kinase